MLKGTEGSLSYVQCFLHLVSPSIKVAVFHITWMVTFWTDVSTFFCWPPLPESVLHEDRSFVYNPGGTGYHRGGVGQVFILSW